MKTQRNTQELSHDTTKTQHLKYLLICESSRSAHEWQWKEWKKQNKLEPSAKTKKQQKKTNLLIWIQLLEWKQQQHENIASCNEIDTNYKLN